jgi:hypothetical protein
VKSDFYVEKYPDYKLVIARSGATTMVDFFAKDYHKVVMCHRDEVPSVKSELIYAYLRWNLKN